jgi:hypothetical protein
MNGSEKTDGLERIAKLEAEVLHLQDTLNEVKALAQESRDALLRFKGVKGTLLVLGAFIGFWVTKAIALFPLFTKGN